MQHTALKCHSLGLPGAFQPGVAGRVVQSDLVNIESPSILMTYLHVVTNERSSIRGPLRSLDELLVLRGLGATVPAPRANLPAKDPHAGQGVSLLTYRHGAHETARGTNGCDNDRKAGGMVLRSFAHN